jgi:hypothetical protein
MNDKPQQPTVIEKSALHLTDSEKTLPTQLQKTIWVVNIVLLIGLAFFVLTGIFSDITENSKTFGLLIAISSTLFACLPIFFLYFLVWKYKKMLFKVTTIFWALGSLFIAIVLFFLISTLLFNTMFGTDFFGLPKLPKF